MKLIIQIPCFNEEDNIGITIADLPRYVDGFDCVEWLIIDDGSTDKTQEAAKACGIDHIIAFSKNQGLARAFKAGIEKCLELGADVIVNLDADNQYEAADIPKITRPILDGTADFVIGERPIKDTSHFSITKKILQRLGSWVVRKVSTTNVPDAPSGFRALSRECALRINIYSNYTYTLETIIQAGRNNMAITSVPIRTNPETRPSRLFSSTFIYIIKSVATMIRIFAVYQPFRFFMIVSMLFLTLGLILGLRFLYFYFSGNGDGFIQSVILSGVLLGIGFQILLMAFSADLMSVNRRLLEEIRVHLLKNGRCGEKSKLSENNIRGSDNG